LLPLSGDGLGVGVREGVSLGVFFSKFGGVDFSGVSFFSDGCVLCSGVGEDFFSVSDGAGLEGDWLWSGVFLSGVDLGCCAGAVEDFSLLLPGCGVAGACWPPGCVSVDVGGDFCVVAGCVDSVAGAGVRRTAS
jgi:hypothetical protein